MKKLTIALALILCLVMCVFCFASCKKKNKTPATTVADTTGTQTTGTTAHVHTPASNYTVDVPPTCSTPGSQSKHCKTCGAIIPETVIPLDPDSSLHVVNDWTENVPGTLLADGHRTGTCSVCDQPVNEVLKVEPTVVICTDATSAGYATEGVAFADILGDKHFYPTTAEPEGNDLLIEYSVLFNGTMLNLYDAKDQDPYVTARINKEPVLYWSPTNNMDYSDAKFAGAFEWMGNFGTPISDSEVTTPATMCGVNPNYSDYPNVGGADQNNPEYGWHRIQIRVHQELIDEAALKAEAAGTAAGVKDYVAVATVYIDGAAAFKLSTGTKGLQKIEDNLFTAEADGNGGITYTDGNASVIAFYINRTRAVLDEVAYVAVADINVTCGKEFVQKDLSKVAYPAPKTFVVDEDAGVEIDAPMYYTVACEGEHEWDDEWVTYVAPTLLSDGVEAQHCTKCGQSQSRTATYEPIVYLSSWDDETKNVMPYTADDEDYKSKPKPSFDIKTRVQSVRAGDTFAPTEENENGKDLFVEFSFLYNETQQNLKSGGDSEVLTVMYIENYNIFNINLKTGKIVSRPRTGDVILFKADPSGEIAIGEYGWHRFGVKFHEDAVIETGEVKYTLTATAYLDGEKILEVDKTAWALSLTSKVTGLLYFASIDPDDDTKLIYEDPDDSITCVTHIFEQLFYDENKTQDVYLVLGDVYVTCGTDFVQKVEKVADPAADTITLGTTDYPAAIYYKLAD